MHLPHQLLVWCLTHNYAGYNIFLAVKIACNFPSGNNNRYVLFFFTKLWSEKILIISLSHSGQNCQKSSLKKIHSYRLLFSAILPTGLTFFAVRESQGILVFFYCPIISK